MYVCSNVTYHDSSVIMFIWQGSKFNAKHQITFCLHGMHILSFTLFLPTRIVLQPNITDISITPDPNNDSQLLHQFNDAVSLTCTAEGGPRIMTRWQFDNGSSVITVASGSSSVTYNITSLSTEHTGVYYCEAIIDGMTDTSMNYTLFGECVL